MDKIKEPMTATKVEEACKEWAAKVRAAMEPFLMPILNRCMELIVLNGQISNQQIEEIANDEIDKENQRREKRNAQPRL